MNDARARAHMIFLKVFYIPVNFHGCRKRLVKWQSSEASHRVRLFVWPRRLWIILEAEEPPHQSERCLSSDLPINMRDNQFPPSSIAELLSFYSPYERNPSNGSQVGKGLFQMTRRRYNRATNTSVCHNPSSTVPPRPIAALYSFNHGQAMNTLQRPVFTKGHPCH